MGVMVYSLLWKDPKLRELWYIPYYGSCRILSINRTFKPRGCLKGSLKGSFGVCSIGEIRKIPFKYSRIPFLISGTQRLQHTLSKEYS